MSKHKIKAVQVGDKKLQVTYVPISELKPHPQNPRVWSYDATEQLKESMERFGLVDPLVVNSAPGRKNIIIGGNFRYEIAKELNFQEIPVVYIFVESVEKERELLVRLNKNVGEFDWSALGDLGEGVLQGIGFSSEELDKIFPVDENPEKFDLEKELKKLNIEKVEIQTGDVFEIVGCRIMNGDSTSESDMLKLMNGEKADMCFTDPPYLLDYLHGKKKKKATEGFGLKRDRGELFFPYFAFSFEGLRQSLIINFVPFFFTTTFCLSFHFKAETRSFGRVTDSEPRPTVVSFLIFLFTSFCVGIYLVRKVLRNTLRN